MKQIAEATWICGDPGMQFDTTTNDWHTCPNTARINASNPCSEYMFLDDSACNLSSINLMKFVREEDAEFDVVGFEKACRTMIVAQEILVDNSSYPTPAIAKNSHDYRPLGLGYANLGALLMSRGMAYDSDAGRDYAGAITALMHGAAFAESSRVARDHGGPFAGYEKNKEPFMRVMKKHRAAIKDIEKTHVPKDLLQAAKNVWDEVIEMGEQHGFRNGQATVLAPTGTIGFMMDCDTTGVEPDIALVKYKKLVGGGLMKIVNQTVPMALHEAGLQPDAGQGDRRVHRRERDHRGRAAHQGRAPAGLRLRLQAGARRAVDPLHGPHQDDGRHAAVPLRRDQQDGERAEGSDRRGDPAGLHRRVAHRRQGGVDLPRRQQAHAAAEHVEGQGKGGRRPGRSQGPRRRKLPDERHAITHKFDIAGHEGYITVGLYEDGMPGELFIVMAKEGSTISGFADAFAQAISYALQYGVPLQDLVDKFSHVRFEPSGMTKNPDVRFAKSIVDYIFRWMASKFLSQDAQFRAGVNVREDLVTTPEQLPLDVAAAAGASATAVISSPKTSSFAAMQNQEDAPPCSTCGSIMVRSGSCYKCANCGNTSGCA